MEDSNEILRFISETHRREFRDRRQEYEWKVLVATVSFYVLATGAVLSGRVPHATLLPWLVWAGLPALAVASALFLCETHKANRTNKAFAEAAEAALIGRAKVEDLCKVLNQAKPRAERPTRFDWAYWWQVAVIFAFALAAAVLIGRPQI